jgi:hypothetical protein
LGGGSLAAEVDSIREAVARWGSASEDEHLENRRALFDDIQRWKAFDTEAAAPW